MIRGRRIICIANNWEYDPTCKHQVMKRLSRENQVLWVNYHGTRRPRPSRADVMAAWDVLRRTYGGARRVHENFVHFTPFVVPGGYQGWVGGINQQIIIRQIRQVLEQLKWTDSRPTQIWTFAPDVAYLAGHFNEELLVYYCVDEYSEFEGINSEAIRATEHELIAHSDLIFTTSGPLFDLKRQLHPHTHLVRHGVELDHFGRALDERVTLPEDVAHLRGTVFGFFGLMEHWFDVSLIHAAAKRRPDYQFVLIGDRRGNFGSLEKLPNVLLLGRRPYHALPQYCRAFSAGMVPFKETAMTRHVNPIKMREYLAAGLPVVSTRLPEAEHYKPHVRVASDADAFVQALDQVAGQRTLEERERIRQMVSSESWEGVVGRLQELVMRRLEGEVLEVRSEPPMETKLAGLTHELTRASA